MGHNFGSTGGGPGSGGGIPPAGHSLEAEAARRIQIEAEAAKLKKVAEVPEPPIVPSAKPTPTTAVDIQKMLEFFSVSIGRVAGDHWELGPNESEYYAEVVAKQGPDFLKAFSPKLLFWVATALILIPRLYETGVLIAARIKASRETPEAKEPAKGADNAAVEFPAPRGPTGTRQPVDLSKSEGPRSDEGIPRS